MTEPTSIGRVAWVDGDPLMEAIAAAVYEHCEHHDSGLVIDDPRNIAAVAAAVTRSRPTPAPPPDGVRDQIAAALTVHFGGIPYITVLVERAANAVLRVPAIAEALGAVVAVERVRAVHQPVEYRGRVICVDCSAYWGGSCDNGPQPHPCPTIAALDPREQPGSRVHVGGNAEDCPACEGTNPPYPFIRPGPTQPPTA